MAACYADAFGRLQSGLGVELSDLVEGGIAGRTQAFVGGESVGVGGVNAREERDGRTMEAREVQFERARFAGMIGRRQVPDGDHSRAIFAARHQNIFCWRSQTRGAEFMKQREGVIARLLDSARCEQTEDRWKWLPT